MRQKAYDWVWWRYYSISLPQRCPLLHLRSRDTPTEGWDMGVGDIRCRRSGLQKVIGYSNQSPHPDKSNILSVSHYFPKEMPLYRTIIWRLCRILYVWSRKLELLELWNLIRIRFVTLSVCLYIYTWNLYGKCVCDFWRMVTNYSMYW